MRLYGGVFEISGSSKFFVETPTRIKGAPLTLRRKLRTSFALPYLLTHFISICGFAAVSIVFRVNSMLALGAKHIRRSVSEAPLMPSEFDPRSRMRSTKFLEEPKISCRFSAAIAFLGTGRNKGDEEHSQIPISMRGFVKREFSPRAKNLFLDALSPRFYPHSIQA